MAPSRSHFRTLCRRFSLSLRERAGVRGKGIDARQRTSHRQLHLPTENVEGPLSYRPPVVVPPFPHQDQEPQSGNRSPQFHVRPLHRGGSYLRVFAQLQFVPWLNVALGRVEQIHTKDHVVRTEAQSVSALLVRVAKNK